MLGLSVLMTSNEKVEVIVQYREQLLNLEC